MAKQETSAAVVTAPAGEVAQPVEAEAPKYDPASATPEEHARATGQVLAEEREPVRFNGQHPGPLYSWQHAAAAQLHGWNHHKLHDATPLKISKAEYEAALKAVEAPAPHAVAKDGKRRVLKADEKPGKGEALAHDYAPHGPAVSPHFRSKEQ